MPAMDLRSYLQATDCTLTAFAEQVGVSVSTVHGWVNGRRTPELQMALDIKRKTSGKVRPEDWDRAVEPSP